MRENLEKLTLDELRQIWIDAWGKEPHPRIGRTMLEKSVAYKQWEAETGGLSGAQQAKLERLVRQYKRSPGQFTKSGLVIKPGTQIVKIHQGIRYNVNVTEDGFEYRGKAYTSLSAIAKDITGNPWSGPVFFGLKKIGAKS